MWYVFWHNHFFGLRALFLSFIPFIPFLPVFGPWFEVLTIFLILKSQFWPQIWNQQRICFRIPWFQMIFSVQYPAGIGKIYAWMSVRAQFCIFCVKKKSVPTDFFYPLIFFKLFFKKGLFLGFLNCFIPILSSNSESVKNFGLELINSIFRKACFIKKWKFPDILKKSEKSEFANFWLSGLGKKREKSNGSVRSY